ncbi:hypothetical protein E1189_11645 [Sansalvadorimonas verongulae]|nr:hypothetical protein [Sansalvadorimonas verongulae]
MSSSCTALAAIYLATPFFALFTAAALMVGVGGAALMSIELGKGNKEKGQSLFVQSMKLTFMISFTLVAVALFFLDDIIHLMGATGTVAGLTVDFLGTLLWFFEIYSLGWVASCFIRNDTNPRLGMYAMCVGAALNVVFDYLFIFQFGWGVKGAALATGLAQVLMFCYLMSHFVRGQGILRLKFRGYKLVDARRILALGLPTFFLGLRFYFLIPPLMGLNIVTATLFQSTGDAKRTTVLSLSRGFVFVLLGLLILPKFFPVDGVWGSMLFAEVLAAVMSVFLLVQRTSPLKKVGVAEQPENGTYAEAA